LFSGDIIVGGNSLQQYNYDDAAISDATKNIQDWASMNIVPAAANIDPRLGTAAEILITFGYDIYSFIKGIPGAWGIAKRDDVLWKLFADVSMSPQHPNNLSVLNRRMATVDEFVKRYYEAITKKLPDIGMSLYEAGRAVKQKDSKMLAKMDAALRGYYYDGIKWVVFPYVSAYYATLHDCIRREVYRSWYAQNLRYQKLCEEVFRQLKEDYFKDCKEFYMIVHDFFWEQLRA
jgi:hypothetical protein